MAEQANSMVRVDGGYTTDYFISNGGIFKVKTGSYLVLIGLIVVIELAFIFILGLIVGVIPIAIVLALIYKPIAKQGTKNLTLDSLGQLYSTKKATRFGWNEIQEKSLEKNKLKFKAMGKKYSIGLNKVQHSIVEGIIANQPSLST
jgi:hypothetical protein